MSLTKTKKKPYQINGNVNEYLKKIIELKHKTSYNVIFKTLYIQMEIFDNTIKFKYNDIYKYVFELKFDNNNKSLSGYFLKWININISDQFMDILMDLIKNFALRLKCEKINIRFATDHKIGQYCEYLYILSTGITYLGSKGFLINNSDNIHYNIVNEHTFYDKINIFKSMIISKLKEEQYIKTDSPFWKNYDKNTELKEHAMQMFNDMEELCSILQINSSETTVSALYKKVYKEYIKPYYTTMDLNDTMYKDSRIKIEFYNKHLPRVKYIMDNWFGFSDIQTMTKILVPGDTYNIVSRYNVKGFFAMETVKLEELTIEPEDLTTEPEKLSLNHEE